MAVAFTAQAQAPAKAAAGKSAEAPAPSAADKAVDRAVANYKRNKGISMDAKPAAKGAKAAARK